MSISFFGEIRMHRKKMEKKWRVYTSHLSNFPKGSRKSIVWVRSRKTAGKNRIKQTSSQHSNQHIYQQICLPASIKRRNRRRQPSAKYGVSPQHVQDFERYGEEYIEKADPVRFSPISEACACPSNKRRYGVGAVLVYERR